MIRSLRLLGIIVVSITYLCATGQSLRTDSENLHWETGLDFGLGSKLGFIGDLRIAYYPIQYAGVRASVGMVGDFVRGMHTSDPIETRSNSEYTIRVAFNPAVVIRSPRIYPKEDGGDGLYFFAEPGIIWSPGLSERIGARTTCWNIKAGINVQFNEIILTLGYNITNLNLNSGTLKYDPTKINKESISHGGYIGVGFKFGKSQKNAISSYKKIVNE